MSRFLTIFVNFPKSRLALSRAHERAIAVIRITIVWVTSTVCLLITVAVLCRFLSINMVLRFEECDLDGFKISRVGIFGYIRAYQKSIVRFRGVCVRCYYNCLI